ncbi:Uncharacterized protein APZ42_009565 [Daphnia magna]|uniref:Uncharacterized protein n=1 Tax=Daphnia magna TaxID=35525 RepID=A0A162BQM7_9CRUS|nr:Uncharacterized protein APZ42_009565 [Daphnia magna]
MASNTIVSNYNNVNLNFCVLFIFFSLYQNNGKFYIFNLITHEGQYVAIIPDFWFFDDSCYYPNMGGDIAASKRKQPERSWTHYKCSFRGEFESFKEARRRLPRAVEFSDLNTASEADDNMYGRGKRKKRPRQVYSPAEDSASEEDNISDTENNTVTLPPVPRNSAASFTKSCKKLYLY